MKVLFLDGPAKNLAIDLTDALPPTIRNPVSVYWNTPTREKWHVIHYVSSTIPGFLVLCPLWAGDYPNDPHGPINNVQIFYDASTGRKQLVIDNIRWSNNG